MKRVRAIQNEIINFRTFAFAYLCFRLVTIQMVKGLVSCQEKVQDVAKRINVSLVAKRGRLQELLGCLPLNMKQEDKKV